MMHRRGIWTLLAAWTALAGVASAQPSPSNAPAPASRPADGPSKTVRVHVGLEAAQEASQTDGDLVLVIFGAEWCASCRTLQETTLSDQAFLAAAGPLNLVKVDVDVSQSLAERFEVRSVPDLVLLSADGRIVQRDSGYRNTKDLLAWLDQGRQRQRRGAWEGNAPVDLPQVSLPDADDAAGWHALTQQLGDVDPVRRAAVMLALSADMPAATPRLIAALGDRLLAVRVGAWETVQRYAGQTPVFDPWADSAARGEQVAALHAWWGDGRELAPPTEHALAPAQARSVSEAIAQVLSGDPVQRTRGMSALVQAGSPALAAVRTAIEQAATRANTRAVAVLEDVRWAILIPEALEEQTHVRYPLSRGASDQRQDAAKRLGQAGPAALPALKELLNDADSLVRESAVHALTGFRDAQALEAMAALLDAHDSNLRMVAAQQLGRTKNKRAADYLANALDDADELVVCTAIAAYRELEAADSSGAMIACLADPRWRVRAAAAEALGEMEVRSAAEEIEKLLGDADPFVVQAAMKAAQRLGRRPSSAKLVALARENGDLLMPVAQALMQAGDVSALREVYEARPAAAPMLLDAMAGFEAARAQSAEQWKPLLDAWAASDDLAVRRKFARVLDGHNITAVAEYLGDLLADEDGEVRSSAARQVIRLACMHHGIYGSRYRSDGEKNNPDMGILAAEGEANAEAAYGFDRLTGLAMADLPPELQVRIAAQLARGPDSQATVASQPASSTATAPATYPAKAPASGPADHPEADETSEPAARAERAARVRQLHAQWHAALAAALTRDDVPPEVGIAYYLTGDPAEGLDVLARALADASLKNMATEEAGELAVSAIMRRLPWPQGREVLERACEVAWLYPGLLATAGKASPEARALVLAPSRITAALEAGDAETREMLAEVLLGSQGGLLLGSNGQTVRTALAESSDPMARAMALFAQARSALPPDVLAQALRDDDPWVRLIAVGNVQKQDLPQEQVEEALATALADTNDAGFLAAVSAVLDKALRPYAEGAGSPGYFRYDRITVWVSYSESYRSPSDTPPPMVLPRQPAFLADVRRAWDAARQDTSRQPVKRAAALLLAQYGQFEGLEEMLVAWQRERTAEPPKPLLMGLTLTRDERFIAPIKHYVQNADNEYELREALQWLRGVRGDEARQLRREINERMRNM